MIKRIASAILGCTMLFAMVGCGSSEPKVENAEISVKELVDTVAEAGYIVKPNQYDETQVKELLEMDIEAVSEYGVIEVGRTPGIGVFAAVKAKDGDMESAKAQIEKAKEKIVGKAFYPDEIEAVKDIKVEEFKDIAYLYLVNSEDMPKMEQLLKDTLK